jgi:outer membrane protein assembly factor BamB
MRLILTGATVAAFLLLQSLPSLSQAEDQVQWGERHTRNMISSETNIPSDFYPGRRNPRTGLVDPSTTTNVRWVQPIGQVGYGAPIIAEGKVMVGTNMARYEEEEGGEPIDRRLIGDRGVLTCFDEASGDFLWQLSVPKMKEYRANEPDLANEYRFADWARVGICSPPTVEDGLAYLVTNCCEVVCLDMDGMADGNDGPYQDEAWHLVGADGDPIPTIATDADIVWIFDMMDQCGARPHNACNSSVLLDGDVLYVCTGNGVDAGHTYVPKPDAPTLIALHKAEGTLLARDGFEIGPDIFHGQWSSPALGEVDGRRLVFQGCGNGFLYAVDALEPNSEPGGPVQTLEPVWMFNGHPLAQTQEYVEIEHAHDSRSYEVIANPVYYDDKLFVVFTQELFHGLRDGWLVCLDPSLEGDTTRTGGLLWAYDAIGSSSSTPAIADGLLYMADFDGYLHCLDVETGEPYWVASLGDPIWGSPLIVDDKIYIGNGRRELFVLRHGKELDLINRIEMPDRVLCSATAANGTLYIPTMSQLFAIEAEETIEE